MSLRFTVDEALNKGWITDTEAKAQKKLSQEAQRKKSRGQPPSRQEGQSAGTPAPKPERLICSIEGDMPQEKLWRACVRRWPEKVARGELVWEFAGAVPGRKYRLDIAFVGKKLAVESDGWNYHGRFLSDFKRDRQRDRLLVIEGWRVLRFFVEEIHKNPELLIEEIEKALSN